MKRVFSSSRQLGFVRCVACRQSLLRPFRFPRCGPQPKRRGS